MGIGWRLISVLRTRIGFPGVPVGHPAAAAVASVGLPLFHHVHHDRPGFAGGLNLPLSLESIRIESFD